MSTTNHNLSPSQEAIDGAVKLYDSIRTAFPRAVANFELKWTSADEEQREQSTPVNSPSDEQGEKFVALKSLGPKTIQMVVHKIATDSDQKPWVLVLYNALENDPEYQVGLARPISSPRAVRHYYREFVELNYQRQRILEERVNAWKEHHELHQVQSNMSAFTLCEPYFDLREMGTSIIAPLMVEYYHMQWGYWFELLHEIIHGRKMGARCFQPGGMYDDCCEFFNEGEHYQAPKYIPTEMDIFLSKGRRM